MVYVDNMLVKSKAIKHHITDLEETFAMLRYFQMKLNPSKCAFGVTFGKFLSFIVSQRGIEANPKKIQALQEMKPLRMIKKVLCQIGRIIALNRFSQGRLKEASPSSKLLNRQRTFNDQMSVKLHSIT